MKGMSRMEISSVKDICVLIFLGINSWTDIRKRQVSLLSIVIFAICGTAWSISSKVKVLDFFLCAGIGLIFVGISIFTEDAVGMGDGWLIMALGTVIQPVELFSVIFIAVMCSAVWAGITLAIFHRKGCTEIPFVPFLLIGYLGGMIL